MCFKGVVMILWFGILETREISDQKDCHSEERYKANHASNNK
jgi:hypothetical protein